MGLAGGPDIEKDGLIFYYDTGNNVKSYKGEPTTNYETLQADPVNLTGFSWGWTTQSVGWYHGKYCLKCRVVSPGNNPNWTGAYSGISLPTTAGQVYTRSCELLVEPGGDHAWTPNVNATHGGTGGINAYYDMNNKGTWQKLQAYVTATGSSTPFYYYWFARGANDPQNVAFTVYMYHPQLENKSYATAFTPTSRGTTQGLLPLVGNNTIDLSNVSFDSNAQMVFDGTNDYVQISLTGVNLDNGCTIEGVLKRNSTPTAWRTFFNIKSASSDTPFFEFRSGGNAQHIYADYYNVASEWSTTAATLPTGDFGYAAACYDGNGTIKMYFNGELVGTTTGVASFTLGTSPRLTIGRAYSNDRYTDIEAPVVKVYNRALTAAEVKQNFQGIRKRYGL